MKSTLSTIVFLLFLSAILSACVTAPKVTEPTMRFFWPPEPDVPKIEWIAVYTGDLDIIEKTFMSAIVGDDSNIRLSSPVSVAGDGEGIFVVADQDLAQVFMFNINKHTVAPMGGSSDSASIERPSGIAVDAEGKFYISDTRSRKVFVLSAENKILKVMDFSKQAKSIGAIAIDRVRNTLAVPDASGGKVLLYSLKGELLLTIDGKGHFSKPNAVAIANDGSMFIADTFNATINHFSLDGKFIKAIGKRGDGPGDLMLITGVAVDSEDHIYATDGRQNNITIFDKDGNTLLVIGGQHSVGTGNIGRGGFQIPQGITIDKNDRIYVADSLNRRVQVFQYLNQRYMSLHPLSQTKQ